MTKIPKEAISALKRRVLSHAKEAFRSLYPNGYLAPRGGYWFVPAPVLIKISFKEGKVWDLKKPAERTPFADLIHIWGIAKGIENFKKILEDMERWCDDFDRGSIIVPPGEHEDLEEIKEYAFALLLDSGTKEKIRGTGRSLWRSFNQEWDRYKFGAKSRSIREATQFLRLLERWAITGDNQFFTVTMKARSKKTEFVFVLTMTNQQYQEFKEEWSFDEEEASPGNVVEVDFNSKPAPALSLSLS